MRVACLFYTLYVIIKKYYLCAQNKYWFLFESWFGFCLEEAGRIEDELRQFLIEIGSSNQ